MYSFVHLRGELSSGAGVESTLGGFLKGGLAHIEYVEHISRKHGFNAAADYLANRAFAERVSTRIGDFGEILAGQLLSEEEGLSRLVEKARYKDDHDWSMRLTDVFCVKERNGEIERFVFCEAKAGTTAPPEGLALAAYQRLIKDVEEETPEIFFFTLERLWTEGRYAEHERLDDAMRRRDPLPRSTRMVLVFDDQAWSEEVLEALEGTRIRGELAELDDFSCYLMRRAQLRDLIERAYEAAGELGQP